MDHILRLTQKGVASDVTPDFDGAFARMAASDQDARVLFYFHGGLVPEKKGIEIATALAKPEMLGALGYEQIYVIWRTGLIETVSTHLLELGRSKGVMRIARHLIEIILDRVSDGSGRGDGGDLDDAAIERNIAEIQVWARQPEQSTTRARDLFPESSTVQSRGGVERKGDFELSHDDEEALAQRLRDDDALQDAAAGVDAAIGAANGRSAGASAEDLEEGRRFLRNLNAGAKADLETSRDDATSRGIDPATLAFLIKNAIKITKAVFARYKSSRAHGPWPTLIEEIARALFVGDLAAETWGAMKSDAPAHFGAVAKADGKIWIEKLKTLADAKNAQGRQLELAVGGHSAGSILGMHFLKNLGAQGLKHARVRAFFLAPAIDLESFEACLGEAAKFVDSVRIFTMTDEAEADDALLGPVYPRSLLYLISGVLELDQPDDLLLGLQRSLDDKKRTYRGKEDGWRKTARDWAGAVSARFIYGPVDRGDGKRTAAKSHGTFDQDAQTVASAVYFLKSGA